MAAHDDAFPGFTNYPPTKSKYEIKELPLGQKFQILEASSKRNGMTLYVQLEAPSPYGQIEGYLDIRSPQHLWIGVG